MNRQDIKLMFANIYYTREGKARLWAFILSPILIPVLIVMLLVTAALLFIGTPIILLASLKFGNGKTYRDRVINNYTKAGANIMLNLNLLS
jgi:hypothetical protein